MCSGLPVIASRHGGMVEMIDDGFDTGPWYFLNATDLFHRQRHAPQFRRFHDQHSLAAMGDVDNDLLVGQRWIIEDVQGIDQLPRRTVVAVDGPRIDERDVDVRAVIRDSDQIRRRREPDQLRDGPGVRVHLDQRVREAPVGCGRGNERAIARRVVSDVTG